jgi:hypothetical protein
VVAGVSKDTTVSLTGTLPFTLEVEETARHVQAPARFFVDVTAQLTRAAAFRTFAVRWDGHCPAYRLDIPDGVDAARIAAACLRVCNDVAYPGYPYPLARVHQAVHYSEDRSGDLKRQLEARIAEQRGSGFSMRLFGRGRDVLRLGE